MFKEELIIFSLTVQVCIDLNLLQQETSQELIFFKLISIQNIDAGSFTVVVPNRPSTFIEITMYENDMYDFHAFDHVKKCLKKLKQTLKTTRVPSKTFKINKTLQKPGGCENCSGLRFEPGQW